MSFGIRSRTTTENCVTGAFNQAISTNVYSQGPKGDVVTPWIFDFSSKLFCEIVYGYVFGVKESNGDSWKFLSLSRDLETWGHCLFVDGG